MKRIVIGTEGSPDAAAAVQRGLELAHDLGATVTFVCARSTPNALFGEPFYQRELNAEIQHAREVIAEAMHAAETAGVDADYEILDGSPSEAILNVAATHDADMIIVGSRGLGAVQSVLFGSVSRAVAAHSTRPVMIVKEPSGDEAERDVALVNDGAVLR
jgi:nucleotide-binding universal stress UspA family protein